MQIILTLKTTVIFYNLVENGIYFLFNDTNI